MSRIDPLEMSFPTPRMAAVRPFSVISTVALIPQKRTSFRQRSGFVYGIHFAPLNPFGTKSFVVDSCNGDRAYQFRHQPSRGQMRLGITSQAATCTVLGGEGKTVQVCNG